MRCLPWKLSACLAAAALSALPGCRRDEITHVKVPKGEADPALARPAAMASDLVRVERQHLVEREERGLAHSARRLNTPP